MNYKNKIYGAITGAAVGEAMGAATSCWTTGLILDKYGKYVTELIEPPVSTKTKGESKAGEVTDGFSFSKMMMERMIEDKGIITQKQCEEVLVSWAENKKFYKFAKINSESAYNEFAEEANNYRYPYLTFDHHRATYEAATRAVAIAVFLPGNPDMAVEQLCHCYKRVFNNVYCLAGAGAVAAAITTAMKDGASYYDILAAGVAGADRAEKCADSFRCQPCALSNPRKRIQIAIEIGNKYAGDFEKAMKELEECIGTSEVVSESVATVFGIIAACKGNYQESMKMAVNIGGETDALATMVGAILGAFTPNAVKKKDIETVERANGYNLKELSEKVNKVAKEIEHSYI